VTGSFTAATHPRNVDCYSMEKRARHKVFVVAKKVADRQEAVGVARKPTTIDAYLAMVKGEKRAALEKLRKTIRAIIPQAEECISYRIPAFRLNGKIVAGFLATAKGCSYFPFSGTTLTTLAEELEGYEMTKGSLHFDPYKALPAALVRKLIKARMAET
jgi:uncharacterized protein YdhG (YjbR/CyaY superfamily)